MSNVQETVERYIAMWNEPDTDARRALIARTVTDDASYLDPVMEGRGIDGISEMIGAAQQQFPGHRFALADGPDAHHDRVRFTWSLAADDGPAAARGTDFVTLDADGRMASITGFLETGG